MSKRRHRKPQGHPAKIAEQRAITRYRREPDLDALCDEDREGFDRLAAAGLIEWRELGNGEVQYRLIPQEGVDFNDPESVERLIAERLGEDEAG